MVGLPLSLPVALNDLVPVSPTLRFQDHLPRAGYDAQDYCEQPAVQVFNWHERLNPP
jgi:hypothetical protein